MKNFIDYSPFLAALATFVTAFVTFLSVRLTKKSIAEMEKQRESSYKPELYIGESLNIELCSLQIYERYRSFGYLQYGLIQQGDETVKPTQSCYIEIFNAGFGAAKNVSYEWDFDKKKLQKQIESSDPQNEYTDTTFSCGELKHSEFIREEKHERNFNPPFIIRPNERTDKPTRIKLCKKFVDLISIFSYILREKKRNLKKNIDIPDVFTLYLSFEYSDIYDKKYYKKYKLDFRINISVLERVVEKSIASFDVDIREIT